MKGKFRLSERGTIQQREHADETGLAWRKRLTNKNLRLDQEIITYSSEKYRYFVNDWRRRFNRIRPSALTCWRLKMNHDELYQEIEPGVMVLAAAYAASLIGMIFWVVA